MLCRPRVIEVCGEEIKPTAQELALGPEQVKPLSVGMSGGGAHQEPVGIPGVKYCIATVTVTRFSLDTHLPITSIHSRAASWGLMLAWSAWLGSLKPRIIFDDLSLKRIEI